MKTDCIFQAIFEDRGAESRRKTVIIAELSASHGQSLERALELIDVAADVGADVVKLQTYRADTITIDSEREYFIRDGTIWDGRKLYDLYEEAHTPWEWHQELFARANAAEIPIFSTPFDTSAVDFLETLDVPAYKIGSFELIDIPLLERVARTKKPLILSTGMATLLEIQEAVLASRGQGAEKIALMKTNSAYPSPPDEINLETIPHLRQKFGLPVGLSDHSLGTAVPIAAVATGAQLVEKHLCLSRDIETPDSRFAMEPDEFRQMVDGIRTTEKAMGSICYGPTRQQEASIINRRSLFIVQDIEAGHRLTPNNVRSIRPGHGLHPRYYEMILGIPVNRAICRGTPLKWSDLATP